jgi:secondary thiamine-phosphate synthase enzyme
MTGSGALRVFAVDWGTEASGSVLEGLVVSRTIELRILYPRRVGMIDITEVVQVAVAKTGLQRGIAHLLLLHNTAALMVGPASESEQQSYLDLLSDLVPERNQSNPVLRSMLVGASLCLQLEESMLSMGETQRILMAEFDGGQERVIRILLLGL